MSATTNVKTCPACGGPNGPAAQFCSQCGLLLSPTGEAASDPLVGRVLTGGYRIGELIAEGSMGRVYRAEQANLGRAVAVKVMSPALVANPQMVDRFRTEARAASSLNHPNCVRVFDFGETHDGRPYMVMELLKGQDLEALLAADPFPPVARALDITLQILSALEEAHELGVVHRDLKPANVIVQPQRGGGELVKVVDFGLAKLRSAASAAGGLVFGTPEYITPEQATAAETDARTDLYACGVILYEMIAGRRPFVSDDPTSLLKLHAFSPPPPLAELAPDRAGMGLDAVVHKAIAKKPDDRYESATAFAEALREVVAYRTGETRHSDGGGRSWIRVNRRPCAECGAMVFVNVRFCGECGASQAHDSGGPASMGARPNVVSAPSAPPRAEQRPAPHKAPSDPVRTAPTVEAPMSVPPSASVLQSIERAIREAEDTGDAASALVFLEQIASSRLEQGDSRGAVAALRRGIALARADLDKGDLDDPIRAVAIFTGKLGDALLAGGEPRDAHRAYKDALALSRPSSERARLYVQLSKAARAMGHEADAAGYLDAAEREASRRSDSSRRDVPPFDARSRRDARSEPPEPTPRKR